MEPKPKLLSPDIFWWGGGLPREGVGAKKFGISLKTRETKLFWRDIPGFAGISRECPKSLGKNDFVFNVGPLSKRIAILRKFGAQFVTKLRNSPPPPSQMP